MPALLLLLLACPGAGAAPPPGLREVERLEARFSSHTARLDATLAAVEELHRSFAAAPDQGARLVEAERRLAELEDGISRAMLLRGQHRKLLQGLMLLSFSKGAFEARHGRATVDPTGSKLLAYEALADDMAAKTDHYKKAQTRETAAFAGFRAELERRSSERGRRLLVSACAVLLLGGAAAFWRATGPGAPGRSPAAPGLPAVVAGNFEVVGLLGRGGMGEVYEAVERTLGRRAALKRLRPELLQDPDGLERLLKEARLMASLKHPNLVAIHSVERDAGQVYLVLEFVAGASLQRRLEAERRLPWPEALRIARGVGAALDYAHGMKVVHRDLKPANVMLSAKGEVKVMDFGIAHQAAKSVSRLTRAPAWGTPAYMAPEQELGGVSAGVDIYALSVCLYEMLTGELPFKGPNFLAQKRENLYIPASRLVPGLPPGADAVFEAALAPEPSRRFKSAGDLLAACEALGA